MIPICPNCKGPARVVASKSVIVLGFYFARLTCIDPRCGTTTASLHAPLMGDAIKLARTRWAEGPWIELGGAMPRRRMARPVAPGPSPSLPSLPTGNQP